MKIVWFILIILGIILLLFILVIAGILLFFKVMGESIYLSRYQDDGPPTDFPANRNGENKALHNDSFYDKGTKRTGLYDLFKVNNPNKAELFHEKKEQE